MATGTTTTIEEVVRRLGLPTRAQRIPCPNHPRSAPAAILDVRAHRYRCPLCRDVDGDAVDLVARVRGLDRDAARRWIAEGEVDEAPLVFEAVLRAASSPARLPEAERRRLGVGVDVLERLGARFVEDYRGVMGALAARFSPLRLRSSGVFNRRGHLVFYRHRLVLPFRDRGRTVHLVGLGPGELHPIGRPIPVPYNVDALDREPGEVILCVSVRDALLFEEWGCPAIAAPEPPGLRDAWRQRFSGRRVLVLEDPAAGGRAGAEDRAAVLRPVARSVDVVHMPGSGRTAEILRDLARREGEADVRAGA